MQVLSATKELRTPATDFTRFVSEPASCRALAVLRVGLALVLLVQAFTLMDNVLFFYGEQGIVQWSVSSLLVGPDRPHLAWLMPVLEPLGIGAEESVRGTFLIYAASLAALLIGWQTRLAAVLACLTHMVLMTTGTATIYGVDTFAQIALFYCTVMPVGHAWSADAWSRGESDRPSAFARLSLRVLQVHLCIVYFSSGLDKAEGIQWWNGEAIWRGLMRPDLNMVDITWLASMPWLAAAICWSTLVLELGYAIFVWPKRTRVLWALATIGLHVGIAVMMGLWSFSGVMIVLTGAAFLVPADPRLLLSWPRGRSRYIGQTVPTSSLANEASAVAKVA